MTTIRQLFPAWIALLCPFPTVLAQLSLQDILSFEDQHLAQDSSPQAFLQYGEGIQAIDEEEEDTSYVRRGGDRTLGILDRMLKQGDNNKNTVEEYDVVIIGAGMAGLAAAKEIQDLDPRKTYLILESTDAVGGRVRTTTFGATGREVTIEDGANWLYNNNDYPTWQLANDLGIESTESVYSDFTMYNEQGGLVDNNVAQARLSTILTSYTRAENEADNNYENSEQPEFVDNGVVALLSNNGWTVAADSTGNMDYVFQWLYIDFEYAEADTSVRYFPYISDAPFMVHDQRGYRSVLETFKDANIEGDNIRFNSRVVSIDYNADICSNPRIVGLCFGKRYRAIVRTDNGFEFRAQRVISTVSAGVLTSGDIKFTPELKYPESPYEMAQYIKVFYQFETKFWDSTPFIYTIRDVDHRGQCHHWQDMDALIPGSGIIRCELMTEAFLELIDEDTQALSEATLDTLLNPLRLAYGNETVGTPIATYYPKLNLDPNFGYGAYANWKIGSTLVDFAHYFGGVPNLVNKCDHNGCNSDRDWIVHLSGSASCYEHAEYVHGAFFAGQRSARFVLNSLGVEGVDTDISECDVSFPEVIYDLPAPEKDVVSCKKDAAK